MNTNSGGLPERHDPEKGCGIILIVAAIMSVLYIVVGILLGPLAVIALMTATIVLVAITMMTA